MERPVTVERSTGRDYAKNVADRGLLLQRLLGLVEQPGVLDSDHRLCREALEQRDLLVRERADLLPVNRQRAQQHVILDQRDLNDAAGASEINQGTPHRVTGTVGFLVGYVSADDQALTA